MKCKWMLIGTSVFFSTTLVASIVVLLLRRRRSSRLAINNRSLLDISSHNVVVIDNESHCEEYFADQLKHHHNFIGFDCEWVSDNNKSTDNTNGDSGRENFPSHCPVALLQIAFPNGDCALVRLYKIGKITQSLEQLLQDRCVLKFGVGVCNDVKRLAAGYHVITEGVVELGNLAIRCGIRRNCSLSGLTRQIVGSELLKERSITCSDWEQDTLTQEQVNYAASDAIAALYIVVVLVTRKLEHRRGHWGGEDSTIPSVQLLTSSPTGNDSSTLELLLQDDGIKCTHSLCQGLIGVEYRQLTQRNTPLVTVGDTLSLQRLTSSSSAYSIRKSPLYHNCQLKGPDGTLLSTVDRKKLDWYISKGLGKLVSEDPPTVQLEFEPSGKPDEDRQYYLTEKENVCVVCGKDDSYIRKNVIPHEYRKHFPKGKKEHMSHDVLLLCVPCHQLSDSHDRFMRREVTLQYGVPLDAGTQKFKEDSDRVRMRSLARALNGRRNLPEERKAEILTKIASYLNCEEDEVTAEAIEGLASVETRSLNEDFVSHGELVVRAVMERGELTEFQKKWRVHFVESMKPQFLPKLWSIDHNPTS